MALRYAGARTCAVLAAIISGASPVHAQGTPVGEFGAPAGLIACPIEQAPVRANARPDPVLFRRILRCKKGELVVAPGEDGAVHVDVTGLQVGTPRPWSYQQDLGSGKVGTRVYPVRTSYSVRTYYRTATEVSEGWIRITNFYVDPFGEWRIGSEESVRSGTFRRIPRS